MIVELTETQLGRVRLSVSRYDYGNEEINTAVVQWLDNNITPVDGTKTHLRVLMPCIGWVRVADALFDAAFTTTGRRERSVPTSVQRALASVQAAVNRRFSHPALTGKAVAGVHHDVIPAWRHREGTFSPIPITPHFVVLFPQRQQSSVGVVTMWNLALDHAVIPNHPILDPTEHHRFMQYELMALTDSPSEPAETGTPTSPPSPQ